MAAARREMGPDAMLMNSRKSPPEARHLGEYEVVFADADAAEPVDIPQERHGPTVTPAPRNDRLSAEVAELKRELEGMRRAITRTAYGPAQLMGVSPDVSAAYDALTPDGALISIEALPGRTQSIPCFGYSVFRGMVFTP